MPDIYDRSKALATRLLAPRSKGGKGLELTVSRTITGVYDPSTTTTTGDTVVEYDGSAFRDTYSQDDIDGTLILQSDVKLLVSPVQLDGSDMPAPLIGDDLLFGGTTYKAHNVQPWNYAGLAVGFQVQARL